MTYDAHGQVSALSELAAKIDVAASTPGPLTSDTLLELDQAALEAKRYLLTEARSPDHGVTTLVEFVSQKRVSAIAQIVTNPAVELSEQEMITKANLVGTLISVQRFLPDASSERSRLRELFITIVKQLTQDIATARSKGMNGGIASGTDRQFRGPDAEKQKREWLKIEVPRRILGRKIALQVSLIEAL